MANSSGSSASNRAVVLTISFLQNALSQAGCAAVPPPTKGAIPTGSGFTQQHNGCTAADYIRFVQYLQGI